MSDAITINLMMIRKKVLSVTLSPARVILSEAKDLVLLRGVDSAKGLGLWLRVNSVPDPETD
jgi:hypothetical protein